MTPRPARQWRVPGAVLAAFVGVGVVGGLTGALGGGGEQTQFTSEDTAVYSEGRTYTGPPVQRFLPADSQQLAQGLAASERVHGVCFGWKLVDGSTKQADQGSSRGPGVPADTCPRWAEVEVVVALGSGDDPDAAAVRVSGSPDLRPLPTQSDFVELGVTADALAEEPVSVTGQAALGLPLLLVERGALTAPPEPGEAPGSGAVPPLPPAGGAGSSSWMLWGSLGGLGAVAVVALVLGFRARSRQGAASDTPAPPPPGPPPGPPPPGPPGPPPAGPPGPFPGQAPPPGRPPQPPPWPPGPGR